MSLLQRNYVPKASRAQRDYLLDLGMSAKTAEDPKLTKDKAKRIIDKLVRQRRIEHLEGLFPEDLIPDN